MAQSFPNMDVTNAEARGITSPSETSFFFNFRAYVCSFVVEKVILARNSSWVLVLSDLWHAYCRECNIR